MYAVEIYAAVRRFVFIEGNSRREAARVFGLNRETVAKMCRFSLPPGYMRTKPVDKPKLGPLLPVIDAILEADRTAPVKQRHTAKRIFERLRDEHGFGGGYTVVKDHVRLCRARERETFVPLAHPPGHAQVDFGEAVGVIGGVRQKIHFLCMDLPQSDACFVKAYPRETTEAFLDGHVSAFAFFGGVPRSILYDNTKIAVAREAIRTGPPIRTTRPVSSEARTSMAATTAYATRAPANRAVTSYTPPIRSMSVEVTDRTSPVGTSRAISCPRVVTAWSVVTTVRKAPSSQFCTANQCRAAPAIAMTAASSSNTKAQVTRAPKSPATMPSSMARPRAAGTSESPVIQAMPQPIPAAMDPR